MKINKLYLSIQLCLVYGLIITSSIYAMTDSNKSDTELKKIKAEIAAIEEKTRLLNLKAEKLKEQNALLKEKLSQNRNLKPGKQSNPTPDPPTQHNSDPATQHNSDPAAQHNSDPPTQQSSDPPTQHSSDPPAQHSSHLPESNNP